MMKTEVVWHDGKPEKNGEYIVHNCWGKTESMMFANGKWNTHIDSNGVHHDKSALNDDYVVLWAEYPKPPQMEVLS